MNALGDRHVSVQFGNVHVRHTWACLVESCEHYEGEWRPDTGALGPEAMAHSRATGHATVLITETRQVTNITAEG